MYFYRIMNKEELESKKINNDTEYFEDCINTHKYKKGINYIHLFLNAESCFEDFILDNIDELIVAKFNIQDEILFKYGIGLGGYDLFRNKCSRKYRELVNRNSAGTPIFWVPEISIPSFDFNYDWCVETCKPEYKLYKYILPENFMTDDIYYREIVNDGYLRGYQNINELLQKYKNMLNVKKNIINKLKQSKQININPKDLNNDSLYTSNILIEYALKNKLIKSQSEIKITLKEKLQNNSINITNSRLDIIDENYIIINKNNNHTNPTFLATLDRLGFEVNRDILYSITPESDVIIDYSLVKK